MSPTDEWVRIVSAEDVTEEILRLAEEIEEGWFVGQPIRWEEFIDRLDGTYIGDTSRRIDLGPSMSSSAIKKIKKHIQDLRRLG